MGIPQPFDLPVYVTKPLRPSLDAYVARLTDVWNSGWYTNAGPQHQQLEAALSDRLRVRHLSLFNNATTALMAACRLFELGGEVVTTPFTFPATPHALAWQGLQPVFADIDPLTLGLDPARVEAAITGRTSAILAVHVFGMPCDVKGLQEVAQRHNLRLIYDGAHAFDVSIDGRPLGMFGDATALSFHATKLFHTAEGGALIVGNAERHVRVNLLRNFGIADETEVRLVGINGKMSELHAAFGIAVLGELDAERVKRRHVARCYRAALADCPEISFVPSDMQAGDGLQYFPIRIQRDSDAALRDKVYEGLRRFRVHARRYFYPLCSRFPDYMNLRGSAPGNLQVAEQVAQEILCLPFYGDLSGQDVTRISEMLKYLLET